MLENTPADTTIERHWTVSVYVVHEGRVALALHPRLGILLPPGGHVESGETPDMTAIRETAEETSLVIRLVASDQIVADLPPAPFAIPEQLVRPLGIQLTPVAFDHQHLDIIYLARPVGDTDLAAPFAWYAAGEVEAGGAPPDVVAWAAKAVQIAG